MLTIVRQLKKFIYSLCEHCKDIVLDSPRRLAPTLKQMALHNANVQEQQDFLDFHINLGEGTAVLDYACHCAASKKAVDALNEHKVNFTLHNCQCDCGSEFVLPMPNAQFTQENDEVFLADLLSDGVFDYLRQSTNSCASPDQPGSGSCACASLPLFTADSRTRAVADDAYASLDLSPTPVLHNTRALATFSAFNFACTWKEGPLRKFHQFIDELKENTLGADNVQFNADLEDKEVLVQINEWVLTALSSVVAQDDDDLHASLR